MTISGVVLAKNEENNIVDCLESIAFCDEIIIVDENSEDKTLELAKRFKHKDIKIFQHPLDNDFSAQRNFGLSKAKGEWVLFVDADERVSKELALEISNLKSQISNRWKGYRVKRIDTMWGRQLLHGETGNIKLLRFAKRDAGKWEGAVHEEWKVQDRIGELKNPLMHYPHPTMDEFLKEINFYTDIRSKELYEKGEKVYWWSIFSYPLGKFIDNFFLKKGFLDGMEGLIFAITMSFHSFLVRGKLWSLWDKNKKS